MNNQNTPLTHTQYVKLGMRNEHLKIDTACFKKTTAEKRLLKQLKHAHNYHLKNEGYTKKRLNLSEPITATIQF